MSDEEILFDAQGGVGLVTLNRPKALNALNLTKVRAMDPQLRAWAKAPGIRLAVIEGAGEKAFCAGGDVRKVYDAALVDDQPTIDAFFREEYRLNRLIKTYPKPYVALLDGITMGGGVGLSIHGGHRVATERILFAMPETGIGMIPDVGGTYFLPRLEGGLGLYLALTGARLKAADSLYVGICQYHVPSERLEDLKAALRESDARDDAAVAEVLRGFHVDPGPAPLAAVRADIDRVFAGAGSVAEVMARLDAEDTEWATKTKALLLTKSPFACLATFKQMTLGSTLDFDACMGLEFRVAPRITRQPDFLEGIRAVLVDKDNAPKWADATLETVDVAVVDSLFEPRPGDELAFDEI
jgi:enoyl-CoA hydratase